MSCGFKSRLAHYPTKPRTQQVTNARPLFQTVPYEEYERILAKLDIAQKECMRIADLYRRDRDAFNREIDKIMSKIDSENFSSSVDNFIQKLQNENATLKNLNAKLQETSVLKDSCIASLREEIRKLNDKVWKLQSIPHTDNSAVIDLLLEENARLKEQLDLKNA